MTTMTVVWLGIYLIFRDLFNSIFSLSTIQMLCMFSIIWTSSVFSFWAMKERVDYKYKKLVILTLLVTIIKPIVSIALILSFNDKVTVRIIGIAAVEMLFFLGLFVSMMKQGRTYYSGHFWKYGLRFNIPLIPHYLSQRLLNNADRIMIERMVSSGAAGIYSLAYSLAMLMQLVNTAVRDTISPWTFKKIKAGRADDIPRVAYPAMIIVAALNLLLIAFAPEVVKIFAPSEYYDAIWVIPPVTMSVYFMFLYSFFADFEFYFEKTKLMSIATFIGAAVNIILNLIFIRRFGYYAAGYTTLFCYALYASLHYTFMQKICRENFGGQTVYSTKMIFIISFLFIIMSFGIMMTYKSTIIRYCVITALLLVLFIFREGIFNIFKTIRDER